MSLKFTAYLMPVDLVSFRYRSKENILSIENSRI